MEQVIAKIRDIPDFPKPGIIFKDITPVIGDPTLLGLVTQKLAEPFHNAGIDAVAGMEARGFIFGALVAQALDCGFVPLRKPGKLPADTHAVSYELEYGEATLEMHKDAVPKNANVLLIDDLIATGGTAMASCELIERAGAKVAACAFVIELEFLNGRSALSEYEVNSLIQY